MDTYRQEWWKDFFTGPAARALRQFASAEQTSAEADFLVAALRLAPGAQVLDVPCGDGRLSVELAARGYLVAGVDFSAELLEHAGAAAAGREAAVEWERRDMRDLPWRERFDGAFCFGNSFGYLDDAGNAAFLRAVRRTLRRGARFVLEIGTCAESVLPAFTPRRWFGFGDDFMLSDTRYDPALASLETEYTFVQDGKLARRRAFLRVYTFRELAALATAAGFAVSAATATMDGEPFRLGSSRLYLLAEAIEAG
ncbi:MAG TPA: methyltransferase domain-containing protein [Thermoanaerobaculia bacterium]|nr:methyltransferase domain-containing protein [Thermoanaerobaculia bacterium]